MTEIRRTALLFLLLLLLTALFSGCNDRQKGML